MIIDEGKKSKKVQPKKSAQTIKREKLKQLELDKRTARKKIEKLEIESAEYIIAILADIKEAVKKSKYEKILNAYATILQL